MMKIIKISKNSIFINMLYVLIDQNWLLTNFPEQLYRI